MLRFDASELAFRVGLHQTYVSSVERGERNVTIGTVDRLTEALGLTLAGRSRSWSEAAGRAPIVRSVLYPRLWAK